MASMSPVAACACASLLTAQRLLSGPGAAVDQQVALLCSELGNRPPARLKRRQGFIIVLTPTLQTDAME